MVRYLSRFDYSIQYVEGLKNIVADALSRMYTGCNADIPIDDWVNADVRLDPEGETLPIDRLLESRAMRLRPRDPKPAGAVPRDAVEPRIEESRTLQSHSRGLRQRAALHRARFAVPRQSRGKPAVRTIGQRGLRERVGASNHAGHASRRHVPPSASGGGMRRNLRVRERPDLQRAQHASGLPDRAVPADSGVRHVAEGVGIENPARRAVPTGVQRGLPALESSERDVPATVGDVGAPEVGDLEHQRRVERISQEEDVAWKSGSPAISLQVHLEGEDFLDVVRKGYAKDTLFSKIVGNISQHPQYSLRDGVLYFMNAMGNPVIAIPGALSKGRRVTEIAIDQAHRIVGHKAARKTRDYLARWYWWPSMAKDVEAFCKSCGTCQTTKTSTMKPKGLLHTLPVPTAPWSSIGMDFVGPFPEAHGFDYLLVVICRLTSLVHLIPTVTTARATDIAWVYLKEIVRLHGLPDTIVSDRDPKFISKFWRELHRLMGVRLLMSTAYHPQTDGMSERAIRNVTQVLRGCISNDQSDWVERLPMVEFAINSTINESTGFAPFELTYGNMPRIINRIDPTAFDGVRAFADRALANLAIAHDSIIASRSFQTHYANHHQSAERPLETGDLVYLATKNLHLPKGRAHKLLPIYIGPYPITSSNVSTSNYTLDLPEELRTRNIHPTFHISMLKPHIPNDDERFPARDVQTYYDFGQDADVEWEVDEILAHQWDGRSLRFLVKWNLGDTTWEPLKSCNQLRALDEYLVLRGVQSPANLPKHR